MYEENGKLYIVGSPIGNLDDITLRAITVLRQVDEIYCEDTRITKRLLSHLGIDRKCYRFDQHSSQEMCGNIGNKLDCGLNIAYLSDAGTPGINDPGAELVEYVVNKFGNQHRIVPIPGASAFTAIMSSAGFLKGPVTFLGFMPNKKGRQTLINYIVTNLQQNFIIFESPHRIKKLLTELNILIPNRTVVLGKELTKIFEDIRVGTCKSHIDFLELDARREKGEFVLIVKSNSQ